MSGREWSQLRSDFGSMAASSTPLLSCFTMVANSRCENRSRYHSIFEIIPEQDAQRLAEEVAARKIVPPAAKDRRSVRAGSKPRSSDSVERRRRWVSSSWLPPALACRFTPGEAAALAVVASQAARHGRCDLALDHIASLAGVGRTSVRNAMAEARRLGLITVEERRLPAFRNDTNVVRITSPEWQAWLSMRRSAPGQGVGAKLCAERNTGISYDVRKGAIQGARKLAGRRRRS